MNDYNKLEHLTKTIEAMESKGSKSIVLELQYLQDIKEELYQIFDELEDLRKVSDNTDESNSNLSTIHGGEF